MFLFVRGHIRQTGSKKMVPGPAACQGEAKHAPSTLVSLLLTLPLIWLEGRSNIAPFKVTLAAMPSTLLTASF
jgi:hypothetical protein